LLFKLSILMKFVVETDKHCMNFRSQIWEDMWTTIWFVKVLTIIMWIILMIQVTKTKIYDGEKLKEKCLRSVRCVIVWTWVIIYHGPLFLSSLIDWSINLDCVLVSSGTYLSSFFIYNFLCGKFILKIYLLHVLFVLWLVRTLPYTWTNMGTPWLVSNV